MALSTRVLVTFVDAMGPEQLEHFGDELAFVGHRKELTGTFGYSSGALPTILTGAPPQVHGRMCLFSASQRGEGGLLTPLAWLGLLPRVLHERNRVRRTVGQIFAKAAGLTGYVALHKVPPEDFRWLDLPERDDMFTAEAIGGVPTFLADARAAGLSVYAAPWQLGEDARWEHAHEALRRSPPDLAFMYTAALDGTLHRVGNYGAEARVVAAQIADNIERARDLMSRDGHEVLTLVVGDHGMADVKKMIDPRPAVKLLQGNQIFVDSTLFRVWGGEAEHAAAKEAVARLNAPGEWLVQEALTKRKIPVDGAPYGTAIFVLEQGVIFAPSFLGGGCRGMHGYDLGSRSSFSSLSSDHPLPASCGATSDVASVVRQQLGLAGQRGI